MDIIDLFTDATALIIFLAAFFIAWITARNSSNKIKLRLIAQQSFYLCVIGGIAHFIYAMSTSMTQQNMGNYIASLLLPIFYSAIVIVYTQIKPPVKMPKA